MRVKRFPHLGRYSTLVHLYPLDLYIQATNSGYYIQAPASYRQGLFQCTVTDTEASPTALKRLSHNLLDPIPPGGGGWSVLKGLILSNLRRPTIVRAGLSEYLVVSIASESGSCL